MSRNKYPEITRAKLIEAAIKLSIERGWDKIYVQDIVDEMGSMTKGAFYHHFQSKNDIIDEVTTKVFLENNFFITSRKIKGRSGLEKLKTALKMSLTDDTQIQITRAYLNTVKNPRIVVRHMKDSIGLTVPQVQKIIEEGMSDGSITAKYPKQAAETFMLLANIWLSPLLFNVWKEEFLIKVDHFSILLDGIGLPVIDNEIVTLYDLYYDRLTARDERSNEHEPVRKPRKKYKKRGETISEEESAEDSKQDAKQEKEEPKKESKQKPIPEPVPEPIQEPKPRRRAPKITAAR